MKFEAFILNRVQACFLQSRIFRKRPAESTLSSFLKSPWRIIKSIGASCNIYDWSSRSWSQEGEDLILSRIFDGQKEGFYVDIGAHHLKRFSNTYLFYRLGWAGINVDAMPGSMKEFNKVRPRDVNLEFGVANQGGTLKYYIFNEPALNGFSAKISEERNSLKDSYFIEGVIDVAVKPLREILNEHLNEGRVIDFLTVDVEG